MNVSNKAVNAKKHRKQIFIRINLYSSFPFLNQYHSYIYASNEKLFFKNILKNL